METPNAKIMRILCYSQMFVMSALVICLEFDAAVLIPFTCIFATFVCLVEIVVEDVRILIARAKITDANIITLSDMGNTNTQTILQILRKNGLQVNVTEVQSVTHTLAQE